MLSECSNNYAPRCSSSFEILTSVSQLAKTMEPIRALQGRLKGNTTYFTHQGVFPGVGCATAHVEVCLQSLHQDSRNVT